MLVSLCAVMEVAFSIGLKSLPRQACHVGSAWPMHALQQVCFFDLAALALCTLLSGLLCRPVHWQLKGTFFHQCSHPCQMKFMGFQCHGLSPTAFENTGVLTFPSLPCQAHLAFGHSFSCRVLESLLLSLGLHWTGSAASCLFHGSFGLSFS